MPRAHPPLTSHGLARLFNPLALATVVAPVALAGVYYGAVAQDVYVSESRFVVKTPEKPVATGLGGLLRGVGLASGADELGAAQSAVLSRDALRVLDAGGAYRAAVTRPGIALPDRFNPLGADASSEALYRYFRHRVSVEHETGTSMATLTVRAFSAREAQGYNQKLLAMAEATVNRLNERGRADMVRYATHEVAEAKQEAQRAAAALADFRNRSAVVDPEKQASINLQMISKLQDELIANRTQLRELEAVAPQNAQVGALRAREEALRAEIAAQGAQVAGGSGSLAHSQQRYQQLLLDSQIADKQLAAALAALQEARSEAMRKQAYVERIVEPNLPDAPVEPRRLAGVLTVLLGGLVAYAIAAMLLAGLREHKA